MSKYEPFERHLLGLDRRVEQSLSFAEIENILGCPLPPSARAHQAWWANQRGAGHTQAHSWMGAGWHTCGLDLKAKRVTLKPVALARAPKVERPRLPIVRPLTFDQAKLGIALKLGVRTSDIDITIRV